MHLGLTCFLSHDHVANSVTVVLLVDSTTTAVFVLQQQIFCRHDVEYCRELQYRGRPHMFPVPC